MSRTLRFQPTMSSSRHGRCIPRLERLEQRLALTTSPTLSPLSSLTAILPLDTTSVALVPISTQPAANAVLTSSPGSITVHFQGQMDPTSLSLIGGDVVIAVQGSDGSWTSLFDDSNLPAETVNVDPISNTTDLTLTLASNQTLPAGNYAIVLPDTTSILDADENPITVNLTPNFDLLDQAGGTFEGWDGGGQVISQFSITKPGVTLAHNALDLKTLSPNSINTSPTSTLDLADNPGAVSLYKFTLPAGHFWQFGAEVDSQSGSSLSSSIALFSANGTVIAESSTGTPNALYDPYLFAGLQPGTYYIGVSGRGNLPGVPGGYDPVAGTPGSIPQSQPGGSFQLEMTIVPADSPTTLLKFQLNHADPLDPSPTSLVLAFNGNLDPQSLAGDPSRGFVLVNASGQQFGMTLTAYDQSSGRYTFLFDSRLPAGHYSIVDPQGGATDLIGRTPFAAGEPAGVLGTFDVASIPTSSLIPNNLGTLYPNNLEAGITNQTEIDPRTQVTYRFVVETSGLFEFDIKAVGGTLGVQMVGISSSTFAKFGVSVKQATESMNGILTSGVYYIQFTNTGTTALELTWTIRQNTPKDSLLANGLGQSPGAVSVVNNGGSMLGLLSVDPNLGGPLSAGGSANYGPNPQVSTPSAPSTGSGAAGTSFAISQTTSTGVPTSGFTVGPSFAPAIPGGAYFTVASLPVGMPSTQNDQVGVAGPGATALASSAPGLLQGIGYGQGRVGAYDRFGESVPNDESAPLAPSVPLTPNNGAMEVAETPAHGTRADELALVSTEWLGRVGTFAADWLKLAPEASKEAAPVVPAAGLAEALPEALVSNESESAAGRPSRDGGRVEQANFGAPLFVGLGSVLALRYSPTFRKWVDRNRVGASSRRGMLPMGVVRGPHRKF